MSGARRREYKPEEDDVRILVQSVLEDCNLVLKFEVVFGEKCGVVHCRAYLPDAQVRKECVSHVDKVWYTGNGMDAVGACYHAALAIYARWDGKNTKGNRSAETGA